MDIHSTSNDASPKEDILSIDSLAHRPRLFVNFFCPQASCVHRSALSIEVYLTDIVADRVCGGLGRDGLLWFGVFSTSSKVLTSCKV